MIRLLPIVVIAVLLTGCDTVSRDLVLVRPDGDIDSEIAANLVDLLDEEATIEIILTEEAMTGGDALEAVAEGRADIALISNDQPFRDDIATVMPLYATVLHVVHPADRMSDDFTGMLRNATVFAGQKGSASRRVFERLTANMDLGDDEYTYVTDRTAVADLAVVFAPISPDRLAEYPGVRLWSMGTPDDIGAGGAVDGAVLMNPHFRPFVIPVGTYASATPEPIVTIAIDKIIISRDDLDTSLVYDLINEVQRLRPALAAINPGLFQSISQDFDASRSRFILHSGTQDYLQRSEPAFIERYSGVAEVLVTLMVAIVSAGFAAARIFSRRRKNRIDRFYSAVLRIRNTITGDMDEPGNQNAIDEIRSLQDEAFKLLVDEKLAADESFRIFITLSNDVLHQVERESESAHAARIRSS